MAAKKKGASKSRGGQSLLEAARAHQDALIAAGLPAQTLDDLEAALRALAAGDRLGPAAQVLIRDLGREVGEIQAGEPIPEGPRELLALGRLIAREAPDYSANLIKYAINAATVNHLSYLCDQLQKELGGADPGSAAHVAEEQIRAAAGRAFAGKPELSEFTG